MTLDTHTTCAQAAKEAQRKKMVDLIESKYMEAKSKEDGRVKAAVEEAERKEAADLAERTRKFKEMMGDMSRVNQQQLDDKARRRLQTKLEEAAFKAEWEGRLAAMKAEEAAEAADRLASNRQMRSFQQHQADIKKRKATEAKLKVRAHPPRPLRRRPRSVLCYVHFALSLSLFFLSSQILPSRFLAVTGRLSVSCPLPATLSACLPACASRTARVSFPPTPPPPTDSARPAATITLGASLSLCLIAVSASASAAHCCRRWRRRHSWSWACRRRSRRSGSTRTL